jgi:hypothetical protein
MDAVQRGDLDEVQNQIRSGVDVNARTDSGYTALWFTVRDCGTIDHRAPGRSVEFVRMLLAAGAEVDSRELYDGTPLLLASDRGHLGIVQELIRAGANVNAVNKLGHRPILHAVERGYAEVVDALLAAGADISVTTKSGDTAMKLAEKKGYDRISIMLLAASTRRR